VVEAGSLSIDLATRNVSIGEVRIQLTRKEYKLLQVLATHAGNVVTHEHLQREIWHGDNDKYAQYLRILVRRVRSKIECEPTRPAILVTESGVGYRLTASKPPPAARRN
jgi:two-component system, OmpR family, KDP operon response regulator KdpE